MDKWKDMTRVPEDPEELNVLLEKAVYEIDYEFNNRPDWVKVPLQGISHLTETE